jgi:hypothetical protein
MKHCLIIYYSQSGQALNIARAVSEPLKTDFILHFEELKPKTPFPFPWTGMSFFQAFPESVNEIPCEMEPFGFDPDLKYDLIILAFPVWYLSPAIPLSAFLQSEAGKKVMKDTPVITMMGVRNMWVMAQERVKARIAETGGKLIGNIVLEDPHSNLVSVITIVRWMVTAQKHGGGLYGRLFPPAGVPDSLVSNSVVYGESVLDAFRNNTLETLQDELVKKGAVIIHPILLNIEKRAKVMFGFLSRWILKKGGYNDPSRVGRLKVFKYYLFTVIYLVSPIASLVFKVVLLLNPKAAKKAIARYSSVG